EAVAEPLVRQLVRDDRLVGLEAAVHRLGLVLQRVAGAEVVDDAAGGAERVAAEDLRPVVGDLTGELVERGERAGEARIDGGEVGDAAGGPALLEAELPERGRGEIGDHRVPLAPGED